MSLRFLSIGLLILACGTSDQVTASDREPVLVDADGLLQAAFEAEARGDRESRRRLLADSIELAEAGRISTAAFRSKAEVASSRDMK